MARIDMKRVLLGGLVTAVIVNLGEFLLNGVILADYYAELEQRLSIPAMGGGVLSVFVLVSVLLSVTAVWLYAAVRPRLGPGPATALKVAVVVWFCSYVSSTAGFWGMGLMGGRESLFALAWGLVELGLAVTAGAAVYREA